MHERISRSNHQSIGGQPGRRYRYGKTGRQDNCPGGPCCGR